MCVSIYSHLFCHCYRKATHKRPSRKKRKKKTHSERKYFNGAIVFATKMPIKIPYREKTSIFIDTAAASEESAEKYHRKAICWRIFMAAFRIFRESSTTFACSKKLAIIQLSPLNFSKRTPLRALFTYFRCDKVVAECL